MTTSRLAMGGLGTVSLLLALLSFVCFLGAGRFAFGAYWSFTTPSWDFQGEEMWSESGYSVSGAGDVNGDGYDDVVVGIRFPIGKGKAYLFYGSASGLETTVGSIVESYPESVEFGYCVSSAGDVDGDGYDDIIVGSPGYDDQTGRTFVYHGSADGLEIEASWQASGIAGFTRFGSAVASAGDVNGDGYDDALVGAPYYNDLRGCAFLYLGSATGLRYSPSWTAESDGTKEYFGYSVSSAGDVDGDGYADVIIGHPYGNGNRGLAHVYLGSSRGLDAEPSWSAGGDRLSARFGWSVDSAGDVDNDGYDDVLVGAPFFGNPPDYVEGRAFLFVGSATGLSASPVWTGAPETSTSNFGFGTSVSGAGDINGDGYSDIVVGYPNRQPEPGSSFQGRVYMYFGSSAGLTGSGRLGILSTTEDGWFGFSVAGAGDVDADGYSDVVAGDFFFGDDMGAAFLFSGYGEVANVLATLIETPPKVSLSASARFVVGGVGVTHYLFSLDGAPYGEIFPVADEIRLENLEPGEHVVRVIGQGINGNWQEVPTSFSWTVKTAEKAIVLTGGESSGTALRESLESCSNFVQKSLLRQGYHSDRICRLSESFVPDLNENGLADDRYGTSDLASIRDAILVWAEDAKDLFIYMVGHGSDGSFKASQKDILLADDLDYWLDSLQASTPGNVVVFFDACGSGSFLSRLKPPEGKTRILVASSESDQRAIIASKGQLSFSFFFWSRIGMGESFYEAFSLAEKEILLFSNGTQTPLIEADGDGTGNEKEDRLLAMDTRLGNEYAWLEDIPAIGEVSAKSLTTYSREIESAEPAVVRAEDVIDIDGIQRVWFAASPPDVGTGPADEPETEFDTTDLAPAGGDCYETVHDQFTTPGTYMIAVMASDTKGNVSLPAMTSITVRAADSGQSHSLAFPFAVSDASWETEIAVVNPYPDEIVQGVFTAYDADGLAAASPIDAVVRPKGRTRLIIGEDFPNPHRVRWVEFKSDKPGAVGFQRPSRDGILRAAVPAIAPSDDDKIFISHIASDQHWWTLISLANTDEAEKTLTIRFDNGAEKTVALSPKQCRQLYLKDLFDGNRQPDIHTAIVRNAAGVAGLEMFGNDSQLAGIRIDHRLSDRIFFPHIASDKTWATGIVAYNPDPSPCDISIAAYAQSRAKLAEQNERIPSQGRYFGTVANLGLPQEAAWVAIEADIPVAGFELFATRDGKQLAGYTAVDLANTQGVLPLLESDGGVTGIAFVNVRALSDTVTLTALDDAGTAIAETKVGLKPFEKRVSVADRLFDSDISGATHLQYESDVEVVMFQLNGSWDGRMLDGLPGLGGGS